MGVQMNKITNRGKQGILFVIIALFVITISGCSSTGANKKYYQGYDSVEMRFLPDTPPSIFYYDPQSPVNEIPIVFEVKNTGASDSFGAVYIHGYDSNIMTVSGDQTLSPNDVSFSADNAGNFRFQTLQSGAGGATYVGIAGGAGGTGNFAFQKTTRDGSKTVSYGSNIFTADGKVKTIDLFFNSRSVGSYLHRWHMQSMAERQSQFLGYRTVFGLNGDTEVTPGGDLEVYDFPTAIWYLPESLEEFKQRIMVTSCFDYVTHSTAMVCIDRAPQSNTKKACKASTVSLSGGQGAPVAITSIEQRSSARKVTFVIHVKHNKKQTDDKLLDYNSLFKCNPDSGQILRPNDLNIVYIGNIALSGISYLDQMGNPKVYTLPPSVTCTPDNRIRLDESGNGQIICSFEFDPLDTNVAAYQAPLEIELWYGYSKSIYKDVLIRRV